MALAYVSILPERSIPEICTYSALIEQRSVCSMGLLLFRSTLADQTDTEEPMHWVPGAMKSKSSEEIAPLPG